MAVFVTTFGLPAGGALNDIISNMTFSVKDQPNGGWP